MEFRDLKAQYRANKDKIDQAMLEAVAGGHFIGGSQITELEQRLAEYVGVKHCISCANGTDALQLALMAWGLGSGDAVFVPDFTFFSSAEVVPCVGATPVFVDVREDTYNLDTSSLEQAIQAVLEEGKLNPKVVVAVDLFGQPAQLDEIRQIADRYQLYVLEDGAQGFGGQIGRRKACSLGDISTTSFFPAKPLGCYGDGGAIFTNQDEWAAKLRSLKVHGKGSNKYDNVQIGMNSRLDTIQAAVLLAKLDTFDEEVDEVNTVAEEYTRQLSLLWEDGKLEALPVVLDGYLSSWAQYTLQLPATCDRAGLQNAMKAENIPTMVYYPKPLHEQEAFAGVKQYVDLSVTKRLCETVLSLPMHPFMEQKDIDLVCSALQKCLV